MSDFLYEVDGHLARLTMNRPEHLNCFSEEMIHLWTAALEDIRDRDDIYAVLLSGNGKAFCAGGDVRALYDSYQRGDDLHLTFFTEEYALDLALHRYPKPVLALAQGDAVSFPAVLTGVLFLVFTLALGVFNHSQARRSRAWGDQVLDRFSVKTPEELEGVLEDYRARAAAADQAAQQEGFI